MGRFIGWGDIFFLGSLFYLLGDNLKYYFILKINKVYYGYKVKFVYVFERM